MVRPFNQLRHVRRISFSFSRGPGSALLLSIFVFLCTALFGLVAVGQNTADNQQKFLERAEEGDDFNYILVTRDGKKTVAVDADSGNKLRADSDPRDVISWSLTMADVTVLQDGRHEIAQTLEIPRSDVTLIIGKDAELAAAPDISPTKISEGHGDYETLIRVKNRDNVQLINLGTIESYNIDGNDIGVFYDGRNGGETGNTGGRIFSTGTLKSREPFWVVDSANVRIPVIWGDQSVGNAPLVLEGSEDCQLGFIAGLMGKASNENETLDFNSYNQRNQIDTILGWVPGGTKDEVFDNNSSPGNTVNRIVAYGAKEGTKLASIGAYGINGRRLTQKKYIDNSKGTVVKNEEIITKPVREWKQTVQTTGFPDRLPNMEIDVNLTAVFEDGSDKNVLDETHTFDFKSPTAK